MTATIRPHAAALALLTAVSIAVSPLAAPPDLHPSTSGVRLANTDAVAALQDDLNYFDWSSLLDPQKLLNIPQNLLIDVVNIPYNYIKAVDTYATAGLGYPGVVGTDTTDPASLVYDPQFPNPVLVGEPGDPAPGPIYAPIGLDREFVPVGYGGTGSWWMESTGNTWGWDEGNFGQVIGLSNLVVPIPQLSTPFAYEVQAIAMAEIVANPQTCPFECPDVLGYLGRWFNVPLEKLFTGVTVGVNPDGSAIAPMGQEISWFNQDIRVDPFFFITSFLKSLTMDPSTNLSPADAYGSRFEHPDQIIAPFLHIIQDLIDDYNPLRDGSFLYWGAPALYTVPALLAGLLSRITGIDNPFAAYTLAPGGAYALEPYADSPIIGGDPLDLHALFPDAELGHLATPADLLPGLGAGALNLVGGLLGYLDPDTYLAALDTDVASLSTDPGSLPGGVGLSGLDVSAVTDGLADWQDTLGATISQLAAGSDDLVPWYTDLTLGMASQLAS